MNFTKKKAATDHIEAAIDLFHADCRAPSLTVAAAAEESIPSNADSGQFLLREIHSQAQRRLSINKKEIDTRIKDIRNWLKHAKPDEHMKCIDRLDTIFMILRAYTKFTACYGADAATAKMLDFEDWIRSNYPDIISSN